MNRDARPLRVGYVAKMFPRISETFVLNEILELERQGVEVTIFSAKRPDEGRFHPQLARLRARVHYLDAVEGKAWVNWAAKNWDSLAPFSTAIWRLMESALAENRPKDVDQIWMAAQMALVAQAEGLDALHAHFATLPAKLAQLCSKLTGIDFSFTAHAKDIFVYTPADTGLVDLVADARFVITVTDYNRRYLRSLLPPQLQDKIRLLHNGIDLDKFAFTGVETRDADHILAIGRLVEKKGFDDLLRSLALLRDRGLPFRCTLAGDGAMAEPLAALIEQLDLTDLVDMTGAVDSATVQDLMHRATVFVLPCKVAGDNNMDALPTVLLEALASGLPCVSTELSGIPEIIEAPREGRLVSCGDIEALADEISELLRSAPARAEIAVAGRKKAEREFDLRRNVASLHEQLMGHAGWAHEDEDVPPSYLYLCTDRGIPLGGSKGASIHVREFLRAMEGRGHRAMVAVRSAKPDAMSGNVLTLPQIPRGDSAAESEVQEALGNGSFVEHLSANVEASALRFIYERYSLFGTTGLELSRRWGIPLFLEVNAPLVLEASKHRNLRAIQQAETVAARVFAGAKQVFVVSSTLAAYVLSVAPTAQVTILPNAVDPDRFVRQSPANGDASPLRVGFIGRVRPWHGVDLLVRAVTRAVAEGADLKLEIVGESGDVAAELTSLATELGIGERFVLHGPVEPDAIPAIVSSFDILAAPYPELEGFYFSPLKVFEYMAAGRAIVASSIGQLEELLQHERTALLVPPGDVAALADGIVRLASDARLRSRLGDAARREVSLHHSWAHRMRTLESHIEQVLQHGSLVTP